MNNQNKKSLEELRRQAGWGIGENDDRLVYSTKDRSSNEQKKAIDKRDKDAIEFNEAVKKQMEYSEWTKGPHGMAEKNRERIGD